MPPLLLTVLVADDAGEVKLEHLKELMIQQFDAIGEE